MICKYFIEEFCVTNHREYKSVVVFSVTVSLPGFGSSVIILS